MKFFRLFVYIFQKIYLTLFASPLPDDRALCFYTKSRAINLVCDDVLTIGNSHDCNIVRFGLALCKRNIFFYTNKKKHVRFGEYIRDRFRVNKFVSLRLDWWLVLSFQFLEEVSEIFKLLTLLLVSLVAGNGFQVPRPWMLGRPAFRMDSSPANVFYQPRAYFALPQNSDDLIVSINFNLF